MSAGIDVLEYALRAIDEANAGESNAVRAWARNYMTTSLQQHLTTVPAAFRNAHLGALRPDQSPRRVVTWLRSGELQTLFLAGRVGNGKSHVAWALTNQVVIDHLIATSRDLPSNLTAGLVVPVPDLLDELRGEGRSPGYWDHVRDVGQLALDDMGAARATPWALERMWSLVNHRTSHQLKTIITTNLDWKALSSEWGEPLMDRLRHQSMTVEFTGPSLR